MITTNQIEQVVQCIYKIEGGSRTRFPYGIKTKFKHTNNHDACFNTVMHVSLTYKVTTVDRYFITVLAAQYCPPQDDPVGNRNWKHNAIQILHL